MMCYPFQGVAGWSQKILETLLHVSVEAVNSKWTHILELGNEANWCQKWNVIVNFFETCDIIHKICYPFKVSWLVAKDSRDLAYMFPSKWNSKWNTITLGTKQNGVEPAKFCNCLSKFAPSELFRCWYPFQGSALGWFVKDSRDLLT